MTWLLTAISLFGNYLNCKKIRSCFLVWIGCNFGWCVFDIAHGLYSRSLLDCVQICFCIYGIKKWGKLSGYEENVMEEKNSGVM